MRIFKKKIKTNTRETCLVREIKLLKFKILKLKKPIKLTKSIK